MRNFKGQYTSIKTALKWFFIRYIILFCLLTSVLAIVSYTAHNNAPVKTRTIEKTLIVEAPRQLPPVLERIAKCESGGKHVNSKGQLIINRNKDGSEDVGMFQINIKYWGLQAMKLGYNLTEEKDNIAMALWLYENKGTEPWIHTKHCWNK